MWWIKLGHTKNKKHEVRTQQTHHPNTSSSDWEIGPEETERRRWIERVMEENTHRSYEFEVDKAHTYTTGRGSGLHRSWEARANVYCFFLLLLDRLVCTGVTDSPRFHIYGSKEAIRSGVSLCSSTLPSLFILHYTVFPGILLSYQVFYI